MVDVPGWDSILPHYIALERRAYFADFVSEPVRYIERNQLIMAIAKYSSSCVSAKSEHRFCGCRRRIQSPYTLYSIQSHTAISTTLSSPLNKQQFFRY